MMQLKSVFFGVLSLSIFIVNTILVGSIILILTPIKFVLILNIFRKAISKIMTLLGEFWISINTFFLSLIHKINWDIKGHENTSYLKSYLVCSNHQSWVDIPVLQATLNRRVPFVRFFLKYELIYVPVLGAVWWALDFPFLRRNSKNKSDRNSRKKSIDIESIRKSCEKFKGTPTTILNFLEGTRRTTEKTLIQKSKYQNLFNPKLGGLSYTLKAMGEQLDTMLDVTIFYPDGEPSFWGLMCGRVKKIVVRVKEWKIPEGLINNKGLAETDQFKKIVSDWIEEVWTSKDELLTQLSKEYNYKPC